MTQHLSTAEKIVAAIKSCLPMDQGKHPLHEPYFGGNEWRYLKQCIDDGWVSSAGPFVERFERELEDFTGISSAVAVVNGTAALHLCLKLVGVEAGDEVLVPALTFVATANAVSYCGAIPHFVDSEWRTLGLDPHKLRDYLVDTVEVHNGNCFNQKTGRRIRAVVAMHTFGHPVDLDPLLDLCQQFCLELVEDAAESLGSFYKGRHTGRFGRVAALSFNGNKVITTGGGGAILTRDDRLAQLAKHLATTAKIPHPWEYCHDQLGYNYRLPNINAALGCAQIEQLPTFLEQKRSLARLYKERFRSIEEVDFIEEPPFARSNYWLNTLLLPEVGEDIREELLSDAHRDGLMLRPVWKLMHFLPMYQNCPRMDLSVAEAMERRLINIPSSVALGERNSWQCEK